MKHYIVTSPQLLIPKVFTAEKVMYENGAVFTYVGNYMVGSFKYDNYFLSEITEEEYNNYTTR